MGGGGSRGTRILLARFIGLQRGDLDLSISLHSGYRCSFLFLSSVPIRH